MSFYTIFCRWSVHYDLFIQIVIAYFHAVNDDDLIRSLCSYDVARFVGNIWCTHKTLNKSSVRGGDASGHIKITCQSVQCNQLPCAINTGNNVSQFFFVQKNYSQILIQQLQMQWQTPHTSTHTHIIKIASILNCTKHHLRPPFIKDHVEDGGNIAIEQITYLSH